ncbi:cell division protein ZipA C-terminal FtsZ-binding domain-containing protein [Methylocaldum sp.]|uniref:cell division protein ZipA C-terminal FtsZ-binding domain-containing protein n=1 Tax=Methylocaldum sp. TaxID=1969727 RepID=UPI002D391F81|nr:cell division protein ZipA C-terminal FtsZ-binding domain-containing protein [Methylocaldum sp.]HYE37317.1 cell division protein ZipA C-terminal FtsZ-binding domain-containing protein [Methylocaldum sp.]
MDRDTVRLILLVIGVIVIAGIYVWGRHKRKILDFLQRRGEFDELDFDPSIDKEPPDYDQEDEFESVRVLNRNERRFSDDEFDLGEEAEDVVPAPQQPTRTAPSEPAKTAALGAPFLIQLSVVAGDDFVFVGEELKNALLDLDLIHGDMGIFHRYDPEFRKPLFSVASLVKPGTFPIDDMESFECPGVVLFFQPATVDDPLSVFDDLVNTSHELAIRLNGIEWDETRRPLTEEKIAQMRNRLEEAYE